MKHLLCAALLLGTLSACQQPSVRTPSIETPTPTSSAPGQGSSARTASSVVVGLNDLSRAEAAAALLPGGPVRVVVQVGEFRGWLLPRGAVVLPGLDTSLSLADLAALGEAFAYQWTRAAPERV